MNRLERRSSLRQWMCVLLKLDGCRIIWNHFTISFPLSEIHLFSTLDSLKSYLKLRVTQGKLLFECFQFGCCTLSAPCSTWVSTQSKMQTKWNSKLLSNQTRMRLMCRDGFTRASWSADQFTSWCKSASNSTTRGPSTSPTRGTGPSRPSQFSTSTFSSKRIPDGYNPQRMFWLTLLL